MLSRHSRHVSRYIITERTAHGSRCSDLRFSTKSDGKSRSVGDYFSALRWKAANALTSSLPEKERNLLLDKLSSISDDTNDIKSDAVPQSTVDDEEDDNSMTSYQPSIDEAIAAAKLREAERYEQKWERVKEALIAEAEEAIR